MCSRSHPQQRLRVWLIRGSRGFIRRLSLPRYVGKFSFGQAHGCSQPKANRATKIVGIAVFCTALNQCLAFVLVRSGAILLRVVMWEFAATAEVMFELYWRIARNILIYFSIP
jgi:hypothetical protein